MDRSGEFIADQSLAKFTRFQTAGVQLLGEFCSSMLQMLSEPPMCSNLGHKRILSDDQVMEPLLHCELREIGALIGTALHIAERPI